MKKVLERALPYMLLCACLCCTLLALGTGTKEEGAKAVFAQPERRASFAGERIALRPYLPDEPVWHGALGLWRTHEGLDIVCKEAHALCPAVVSAVYEDRLWGVCVETETEVGRIVYRSLRSASVRSGQKIKTGDLIGPSGTAPCEAELGAHLHIEYFCGGETADPYPLLPR